MLHRLDEVRVASRAPWRRSAPFSDRGLEGLESLEAVTDKYSTVFILHIFAWCSKRGLTHLGFQKEHQHRPPDWFFCAVIAILLVDNRKK